MILDTSNYNICFELGFHSSIMDPIKLFQDQWGGLAVTSNSSMYINPRISHVDSYQSLDPLGVSIAPEYRSYVVNVVKKPYLPKIPPTVT